MAGWMVLGTMAVVLGSRFLGNLIDQVPKLSKKVIAAIRAVRDVRDEIRMYRS